MTFSGAGYPDGPLMRRSNAYIQVYERYIGFRQMPNG